MPPLPRHALPGPVHPRARPALWPGQAQAPRAGVPKRLPPPRRVPSGPPMPREPRCPLRPGQVLPFHLLSRISLERFTAGGGRARGGAALLRPFIGSHGRRAGRAPPSQRTGALLAFAGRASTVGGLRPLGGSDLWPPCPRVPLLGELLGAPVGLGACSDPLAGEGGAVPSLPRTCHSAIEAKARRRAHGLWGAGKAAEQEGPQAGSGADVARSRCLGCLLSTRGSERPAGATRVFTARGPSPDVARAHARRRAAQRARLCKGRKGRG